MKISQIKNIDLLPFLNLDPIYNAWSIYVCRKKPEDTSLAAVSEQTGSITGTLITGVPGIYEVPGYWLAASNYESAEILIEKIKGNKDFSMNYPLWAEEIVKRYFRNADISCDRIYVYPESQVPESDYTGAKAQKLTYELFKSVKVPSEISELLSAEDLLPDSKFCGVIEGNTLCAIGEHIVDSGSAACISQLLTLEKFRRRGYALNIVRELTKYILGENKIPVYDLSEENTASQKCCEKAGFVLHSRTGYMEI